MQVLHGRHPEPRPPIPKTKRPPERDPEVRAGDEQPFDGERRRESEPLEPFTPLPTVLAQNAPATSSEPISVGTSWDRAQVAAMAERMLTSFRRGRVDGREEVRMQLRGLDAEVRVRLDEGRVVATLVGEGLEGLAKTLERELSARGLEGEIRLELD